MDDQSAYRQIRVVIDKGQKHWYIAVLTRSKSRGVRADDRLLLRTIMPCEPDTTAAELVRGAARALDKAADGL